MSQATCRSCGAPDSGELVHCRFCKAPVSAEALASAVPCPRCRAANRYGRQKCAACQSWIVVACVFCGAISPHHLPACLGCQEPFAGAPQRKAARDAERAREQQMQMVGTVGSAFAPAIGAALGAAAGSLFSSSWSSDGGSVEVERDVDGGASFAEESPPAWSEDTSGGSSWDDGGPSADDGGSSGGGGSSDDF